jgi:hypothetical protein
MTSFEIHQNSFQARQGIALDPNSLAELEIGPGFRMEPRRNNRLYGGNLTVVYWKWDSAAPDYCNYAWCDKNWQPLLRVKVAEHIARK